ncbi:P-loop NTPase fold protein [Shimia sp. SK013]|uniref:P-loop NTPase fold protein n=1 Tax=Shimia sp. SK013 TaxID=1389006 RepID=UPI00128F8390|nr:P-loop NTPase fold protein [Shimia sp. SK013]
MPSQTNNSVCLVFESLQHLQANFIEAWQMLSHPALVERSLLTKLDGYSQIEAPEKLSIQIPQYPQPRMPSDMHRSMLDVSELLLLNIDDQSEVEREFLESCYCESGVLNQHSLITKHMLLSRYSSLFPDADGEVEAHPVAGRKNPNRLTPEILTESVSNRPIALVGDVGVGKTSFLKHLMYVSAYREFQKAIYVYIDLGRKGVFYEDPKKMVLDAIETALNDHHKIDIFNSDFVMRVYKSEIVRFDDSIWGQKKKTNFEKYQDKLFERIEELQSNKSEHIKKSLQVITKDLKRQVIIAIDNADQRTLEVQQEAFIIAQNLASEWEATVFISVRPKTFYYSRRSGALSAYPHRVFTISPPRVDEVVSKRLKFAIRIAEGKVSLPRLQAINVQLSGIASLFSVMQDAVNRNTDIQLFLENITGGNIRDLIQFMAGFFGNPNVDLQQIVEVLQHGEDFYLPIHELWKVALKGDSQYFDPERVIAMNVFDLKSNQASNHFICPMILGYLNDSGTHRSKEGEVLTDSILEELRLKGFNEGAIWESLRNLTNKKLIEPPERVTFEEDQDEVLGEKRSSFRITTLGAYHLRYWMASFSYLDAMCVDTPITDGGFRQRIANKIRSHSLRDRHERALLLREYLTEVWDVSDLSTSYFNWRNLCKQCDDTFQKVAKSLARRA